MDDMPPWVRVMLPKVAGYVVGLGAAWLAGHNITVAPEHQADLIIFLTGVFLTIGGLIKTWVSAHLNPANVNSPAMAQQVHEDSKNNSVPRDDD